MTPTTLEWLHNAKPGDRAEYWRGYLARDVGLARFGHDARTARHDGWDAYEEGYVDLCQKRFADNDYSYMMIFRAERRRPTPRENATAGGSRGPRGPSS